ncbi:hypothetical protein QR680_010991 [Steinernema hermaphroditum]|uniref:Nematode cuticle collagen N-terminal domain-containing protein n=1 Tax=Steinernema hermaphroditum TaxID=289476 RepID=A0AA39ITI4_9BILA|nr:hypothetical protein QR680_010991 [Steinernema hermaphroditum]
MTFHRTVVVIGNAASVTAIVATFVVVLTLLADVNQLYNDIVKDLEEFKVVVLLLPQRLPQRPLPRPLRPVVEEDMEEVVVVVPLLVVQLVELPLLLVAEELPVAVEEADTVVPVAVPRLLQQLLQPNRLAAAVVVDIRLLLAKRPLVRLLQLEVEHLAEADMAVEEEVERLLVAVELEEVLEVVEELPVVDTVLEVAADPEAVPLPQLPEVAVAEVRPQQLLPVVELLEAALPEADTVLEEVVDLEAVEEEAVLLLLLPVVVDRREVEEDTVEHPEVAVDLEAVEALPVADTVLEEVVDLEAVEEEAVLLLLLPAVVDRREVEEDTVEHPEVAVDLEAVEALPVADTVLEVAADLEAVEEEAVLLLLLPAAVAELLVEALPVADTVLEVAADPEVVEEAVLLLLLPVAVDCREVEEDTVERPEVAVDLEAVEALPVADTVLEVAAEPEVVRQLELPEAAVAGVRALLLLPVVELLEAATAPVVLEEVEPRLLLLEAAVEEQEVEVEAKEEKVERDIVNVDADSVPRPRLSTVALACTNRVVQPKIIIRSSMTKHLRAVVGVATTASTLAVVVALFVGLSLYHDVNDMYDEVISDLGEFKALLLALKVQEYLLHQVDQAVLENLQDYNLNLTDLLFVFYCFLRSSEAVIGV